MNKITEIKNINLTSITGGMFDGLLKLDEIPLPPNYVRHRIRRRHKHNEEIPIVLDLLNIFAQYQYQNKQIPTNNI